MAQVNWKLDEARMLADYSIFALCEFAAQAHSGASVILLLRAGVTVHEASIPGVTSAIRVLSDVRGPCEYMEVFGKIRRGVTPTDDELRATLAFMDQLHADVGRLFRQRAEGLAQQRGLPVP